ncbi:MAG TPA: alkene reductase [Longimicrobium sp.]|jgi:N-ethylmaleimide reductase|uniref:alkene reductase n=1 Tax=Longimicrobium sp. TaxID=2029185 RepID=UPI002EDB14F3
MSESTPNLFTPVRVGPYTLRNRMVMAPMTRNRAGEGATVTDLTAQYYAQRASAGLIITEGSQISPQGAGYPGTPGIYSDEQVEAWRKVTDAVHARGGRIFLQLWHVGRISHPDTQEDGGLPVAPSAIAAEGPIATLKGMQPMVTPRALRTDEIPGIVADFARGARAAYRAGFDGVELHGANGYLIDQFLRDGSNHRTDEYGGSVENRARFLDEVTAAVVEVWGGHRVGVRLSPMGAYNSMSDSDPAATFGHAVRMLNRYGLAYLHLTEQIGGDEPRITPLLREAFRGPLIINGGYGRESAEAALAAGEGDLVSFGVGFLANPDLVERFAEDAPLNTPDRETFYMGGERGYVDYPTLQAAHAA